MGAAPDPDPPSIELQRRIEEHLDQLPMLPMAVTRLLALDPSDDEYAAQVVEILEGEPNFAARILKAANSAFSWPADPITTLSHAIARIGSIGAVNLVLAMAVTRVFVPRDPWEQSLWRHAVQVAHAARMLARKGGVADVNPEEAYVVGLLHDVGRFVLFQEAPDYLRSIDEGHWDTPDTLVDEERAICGLNHAEIGSIACEKWGLPTRIEQAIRSHHDPLPETYDSVDAKLTALVRLADLAMFPSALPDSPSHHATMDDDEFDDFLAPKVPPFVDLDAAGLRRLISEAAAAADDACEALGIPRATGADE